MNQRRQLRRNTITFIALLEEGGNHTYLHITENRGTFLKEPEDYIYYKKISNKDHLFCLKVGDDLVACIVCFQKLHFWDMVYFFFKNTIM